MYRTYAEYRVALDAGHMAEAMRLEAAYYRAEERRERRTILGITALWAVAAFPIVSIFTMVVA